MTRYGASVLICCMVGIFAAACGSQASRAGDDGGPDQAALRDAALDRGVVLDAIQTPDLDESGSQTDLSLDAVGFPPDGRLPDTGGGDTGSVPQNACAVTGGFCWIHPKGFGASMRSVSGSSAKDVWAVGLYGFVARYDGAVWRPWLSPTNEDLYGVHAQSASDVWAVGSHGTVIHFDGTAWRTVAGANDETLYAVHAVAQNDVWIGGDSKLYHYDGVTLTKVALPFTYGLGARSLMAFASDDVWIGNDYGTILHFDGKAWSYSDSPFSTDDIFALWGSGPDDLWATSDRFGVAHWKGGKWEQIAHIQGVTPDYIVGVNGSGPNDVWFVGYLGLWHYDGSTFTRYSAPVAPNMNSSPRAVWVHAGGAIVVGDSGEIFTFNSGSWALTSGSDQGVHQGWTSIAAVAADDVWFFGMDVAMHYDGSGFVDVPIVKTQWFQELVGAWASGPNDVWVVGIGQWGDNIQHFDGTSFKRVDTSALSPGYSWINDVWGSSSKDVFFASDEGVFCWDGTAFSHTSLKADCTAIDGSSATNVWAVNLFGGVYHFDGTSWSLALNDSVWWTSVRAFAPNDVWVGGGGGIIKHWDGAKWTTVSVPGMPTSDSGNAPYVVSLSGSVSDLWALVGALVLHWDGSAWTIWTSLGTVLGDLAVAPGGSVFVTGPGDSVLRRAP